MRFTAVTLLVLPLVAAAQNESPIEQAKNQALEWASYLQKFLPPMPRPGAKLEPSVASKAGGKAVHHLSLSNWEEEMRSVIKTDATAESPPEDWWVFVTGGNKTCFGHCDGITKTFNETAALWSLDPTAPHLGYINCDYQPVLCNTWGAGAPSLWIFELRPRPAPTNVWITGFNLTTPNDKVFQELRSTERYKKKDKYEGYFHPFDGILVQLHLAQAIGYMFWAFTILPNWLFMIVISFASRSLMGNRMNPQGPAPRAAAPAPAAAPAGGVRR
jgi:hypothetical protein